MQRQQQQRQETWVTRSLEIEVPTYSEESSKDSSLPSLELLKRSWQFFTTPSKEEAVKVDNRYYFCKLVKARKDNVTIHVDNLRGQTNDIVVTREPRTGDIARALTWESDLVGKAAKIFFKRQLEKMEKAIVKAAKKPKKAPSIFWEAWEAVKESQK